MFNALVFAFMYKVKKKYLKETTNLMVYDIK